MNEPHSPTEPSPPPEEEVTQIHAGRPDPAMLMAQAFDAMRDEFKRMTKSYEEMVSRLEQMPKRPEWVDDIIEAVTQITPSKALQAKVETLAEELAEFKGQCDGRHESDSLPSMPPPNGA